MDEFETARTRVSITSEDLAAPDVSARVEQMRSAQATPLVRALGTPQTATSGAWWRGTVASMTLAGTAGGFLGWAISELISRPDSPNAPFNDSPTAGTALFTSLFAVGLTAVLVGWEGLQARSGKKTWNALALALPMSLAGAALGGAIAQQLYEPMSRAAFERAMQASSEEEALAILRSAMHLPRGIAFALFATVVGVALGTASKSGRRTLNGALGGATGGFLGGFVFDFIQIGDGGGWNRAIALTITGCVTGVAIGLVETARKEHWLEIVSGGMAGKQFILYHVNTVIGADPSCHITLIKDPAIAPQHLILERGPAGLSARAVAGVTFGLNGIATTQASLTNGALIQVGATVLRYGEKTAMVAVNAPIVG